MRHISAYPLFAFRGRPFGHHVCAEGALPGAKAKPQTKERSPSDRGKAPSSSKATKGMEGTKATATYKGGRPHVQTRVVMHGGCSGKNCHGKNELVYASAHTCTRLSPHVQTRVVMHGGCSGKNELVYASAHTCKRTFRGLLWGGRPHVQTRVVMHGGCSGKNCHGKNELVYASAHTCTRLSPHVQTRVVMHGGCSGKNELVYASAHTCKRTFRGLLWGGRPHVQTRVVMHGGCSPITKATDTKKHGPAFCTYNN